MEISIDVNVLIEEYKKEICRLQNEVIILKAQIEQMKIDSNKIEN